jgi:hypothetical protein
MVESTRYVSSLNDSDNADYLAIESVSVPKVVDFY